MFATRRIAALAAGLTLGLALPAAAAPPVAPIASKNVSYLRTLDEPDAVSAHFAGDYMYLSTLRGLAIYDIRRPDAPQKVSFLDLPHFENEDVDMSVSKKFVLISNDPSEGVGRLYVIDVKDPAKPTIKYTYETGFIDPGIGAFIPELPFGIGHTASCIHDCDFVYLAGTNIGIAILDLRDYPNGPPKFVKRFEATEANGTPALTTHDVQVDSTGLAWIVGAGGTAAYDVTDPANPVVKFKTDPQGASDYGTDFGADGSTLNDFIHHNSMRLRNSSLASPPAGAALSDPSSVVVVTEEDYSRPQCHGAGSVETWGISGDADKGVPLLHPLDRWDVETDSGAQALCSAHYFDERAGLLTQGWYEQGTRFLDITNPTDIRQVGYWIPARNVTWSSYYAPKDPKGEIVYSLDHTRGVDVIRIDRGAPPDPGPPPKRAAGSAGTEPQLNVTVSLTDGRRRALTGQTLNYAVRLRNRTGAAARGVQVSATLPGGLSLLRGRRTSRAKTVTFSALDLGAHRTTTLRFRARVKKGTRALQVSARARSAGDINPLDDFATDHTLRGRAPRAAPRRRAGASSATGSATARQAASEHVLALAVSHMRTLAGPDVKLPTLTAASQRFGALCRIVLSGA